MRIRYFIAAVLTAVCLAGGGTVLPGQTTVPGWRVHTPLPTALTGHGAVLLHNGDILVAGGLTENGQASTASYLYSAVTGTFTPTLNALGQARAYHALVVVPTAGGSRVFAVGGYTGAAGNYSGTASVEVLDYDNTLNNWRWSSIGSLSEARGDCRAAWDGEGFVVVSGGRVQNGGALHSGTPSAVTERINVQTMQIDRIGGMETERAEHALVRILDAQNRRLLITAGGEQTRPVTSTELLPLNTTVWDPLANPPVVYRSAAVAVGDIAGIARVFGGFGEAGTPLNTCEWYDVKSGWRSAPRMQSARARAHATLIAGIADTAAAYIIVAGQGAAGTLAETEIFELPDNINPAGMWAPFADLNRSGAERTVTVSGSNLPLVTGGEDGRAFAQTEMYQPLRANDVSFGQEEVGRLSDSALVTISNEWLLPVTVRNFRFAGSAEFIVVGDTSAREIAPGAHRAVYVRFRPNAAGERSDLLLFDVGPLTDTVRVRGMGIESEIAVVSGTVAFDSVFVNTVERRCFAAIRNNGTDTTVVDSVVVSPAGVYRLVSPLGRSIVPPGDSLVVCVEFAPQERGGAIASTVVHIAARTFPLAVSGTGIRRYAVATSMAECDTLTIAPGDSITRFVTLHNPGDKPVTVTSAVITASADGLFVPADPAVFPFTLDPGATTQVEIAFLPQREATERATVNFVNDGDTATLAELCFVLRSRFLTPSVGELDLGTMCVGDSVAASFILENPGQYEPVTVQSVAMEQGAAFTVAAASDTTLQPRGYMPVRVRFAPQSAGDIVDAVIATGSFGQVTVPVRARVVPRVAFTPVPPVAEPALTVVIPVELAGTTSAVVRQTTLTMAYNRTLLYPRRIVSPAGAPALDNAQTALTIERPGLVRLDLVWLAPIDGGTAFGVECEVLRGDNDRTTVTISGTGSDEFCVEPTATPMFIEEPCGGQGGFIRTDGAAFVLAVPNPAVETVQVLVYPGHEGTVVLQLVNAVGEPVEERALGRLERSGARAEFDVRRLPAGVYFVRALVDAELLDVQPVMLIR